MLLRNTVGSPALAATPFTKKIWNWRSIGYLKERAFACLHARLDETSSAPLFAHEAQLKNIAARYGRDPLVVDKLLSAPPGSGHCRTASTARSEGPVWPMTEHSSSTIGWPVPRRSRRLNVRPTTHVNGGLWPH